MAELTNTTTQAVTDARPSLNDLARQAGLPMSWLDKGVASAWPDCEGRAMKNHTKFAYAQDVFVDVCGMFAAGFNRRVSGHTYTECFQYPHEQTNRDLIGGWHAAERFIDEGKIYYRHNFHRSHGGCPEGHAFQYGGRWVCNTCGDAGVDRPWWAIKVFQDGSAWICVGEGFSDLQASENYAFGDTREQAISNYGDLMTTQKEPA